MLRFKLRNCIAEKEFKEGRRITIEEVTREAKTNRTTVSKLINQRGVVVRTDVLDNLCRYFACPISDLVEYVPDDALPEITRDKRARKQSG